MLVLAPVVQFLVCFLILRWLLKKKPGEPYSKKTVVRFVLFGALSTVLNLVLMSVTPIEREMFFGMNPVLSGFLTALITAALIEEVLKYLMFRLAVRSSREVVCWLDAIIAAIAVGVGFTLLEDITYLFDGGGTILRAVFPMHLLFQAVMGYYYGKARVTGQARYDVLSLAVPILLHTLFDMFLIGIMSVIEDQSDSLTGLTLEELKALPYGNYLMPMLVCAVVIAIVSLVALIQMLRKIGVWSGNGEKQEPLKAEDAA